MTVGFQPNVFGPPGSGSWASQTELYAFFPDGEYMYFPSPQEAGAKLSNPRGYKALGGHYEVSGGSIVLLDEGNGQTYTSEFSASPDGSAITLYGKTFTRIGETAGLRG